MSDQKIDQATILTELEDLAKAVADFPYFNRDDRKHLKFGQYVTTIETNRKNLLRKIGRLEYDLTKYLAELEFLETMK